MNIKGSVHLKIYERIKIQELLQENASCKSIATLIGKDDRSISNEIKKRRVKELNKRYGLYGTFDDTPCKRLSRFPFVCNGCNKRKVCFKQYKFFYNPSLAQENYELILRDSRIGLDITAEDKDFLDNILKDGVSKGQSIHHIVEANKDELRYSERHIYRLISNSQCEVKPINLRRMVKLKPRKHYKPKEDNKEIRKGRTYVDYIAFLAKNPLTHPVQIDTVEGVRSGKHKCMLTIHFPSLHFMLIYVLNEKTKEEVTRVFLEIRKSIGNELYKKLFPVILTDRGSEFCDPKPLEQDLQTNEILSHVYFCNSYSSYQKGAIEKNHELIRYIIPKGVIFDELTQEKADLITSHINSYIRNDIESTPYYLAKAFWGETILNKLNCKLIEPNQVTLIPKLLY